MSNSICVLVLVLAMAAHYALGSTVMTMSRQMNTCDKDTDRCLDGTLSLIYAWNDKDPSQSNGADMVHHTHRGSQKVHFEMAPKVVMEADTKIAYTHHPKQFPISWGDRQTSSNSTAYISHGYDLWEIFPEADATHAVHMTKWDAFFGTDQFGHSNKEYVHHVNMIPCQNGLNEGLDPANHRESNTDQVTQDLLDCWLAKGVNPICVYVLGMEPQVFPLEAGIKIGGPDGFRYVLSEVHYDIPWYDPPDFVYGDVVPEDFVPKHPLGYEDYHLYDDSGLQLWYTPTLREHDLGPAWIGIYPVRNTSIVPAMQTSFITYSLHNPNCYAPFFPPEGEVNIFQLLLHGHTEASKIRVRHIRDGVELPMMANDPNYDVYYEQWLEVDITWRKDDEIILECEIDSSAYNEPLLYGLGTHEQMCIVFFMIYPNFGLYAPIEWSEDHMSEKPGLFTDQEYYFPKFVKYEEPDECMQRITSEDRFLQTVDTDPKPWTAVDGVFDSSMYEHHQMLDGEGDFILHFTYHQETEIVDLAAECVSDGWVGLGFSPNGGMKHADMVIGWIDDDTGEFHFHDRFAVEESLPSIDAVQNYFDVRGFQSGVLPPDVDKVYPTVADMPINSSPDSSSSTSDSYGDHKERDHVDNGYVDNDHMGNDHMDNNHMDKDHTDTGMGMSMPEPPKEFVDESAPQIPTEWKGTSPVVAALVGVVIGAALVCIILYCVNKRKVRYMDAPTTEMEFGHA